MGASRLSVATKKNTQVKSNQARQNEIDNRKGMHQAEQHVDQDDSQLQPKKPTKNRLQKTPEKKLFAKSCRGAQ